MKFSFIVLFLVVALSSFGQNDSRTQKGQVSFVTSQNIYVRFENTDDIAIGDTLFLAENDKACLQVSQKSSSSCVCSLIDNCEVKRGDEVIFKAPVQQTETTEEETTLEEQTGTYPTASEDSLRDETEPLYKENIRGTISASQYSTISDTRDNRHRAMSRLSINAQHINNSKFSFETYLNYRQIFPQDETRFDPRTSFFRVYNLAVKYDIHPTANIVVGRRINPKIASVGAIDGLQAEKYFGKTYIGAIVGFRPHIRTFNFNPNLLQYGGYAGTSTDHKAFRSQTTVGLIEQRNKNQIDRRYAYFQHSSTLFKNLNLFSSVELDLYSRLNGVAENNLRLTNLFASVRYRFNRKLNLMVSYDSRKRVLYYETFQTEIERLLNDDIARQGIRARVNIRPIKFVSVGLSYAKRFQSDDQNKSDNYHGYATLTKIPTVGGRLSVTYNNNQSNYLQSHILSGRYSRTLIDKKLDGEFYYRWVDYTYLESSRSLRQNYYGTTLSWYITRKLVLSVSGEWSQFNQENNYRIYTRIVKRFYRKRE